MKGITVLKVLAVMLLLLVVGSAPVSAVTQARDEKTTITLIGEDGQGRFTIFLQQTQVGTNDIAFLMDLAVSSNYDYEGCEQETGPEDCRRDLWVAVLLPDGGLVFLRLRPGLILDLQAAGNVSTFPLINEVWPYLTLGVGEYPYPELNIKPYPSRGHLFGITQAAVNGLPPGKYTIYAGYTTRVFSAKDIIVDIFSHAVSNIAEYDVYIDEPHAPCEGVP